MDDPNSSLPSDPTVDESYTRGSRPVQPRTRSGSRTSGNDKDPQKSATKRKKTAGSKTRTSASSSVSTKERPARARTTTSRSASADDNGTEPAPQRRQMVPAQTGPTYRRSYRLSLTYRIH